MTETIYVLTDECEYWMGYSLDEIITEMATEKYRKPEDMTIAHGPMDEGEYEWVIQPVSEYAELKYRANPDGTVAEDSGDLRTFAWYAENIFRPSGRRAELFCIFD